jgi:hypothetical protein
MQIRCHPVASPPDVDKLLGLLAEAGVDLQAVGGSDVEFGGEFAFVPKDGHEDTARRVLVDGRYPFRELFVDDPDSGLRFCLADDRAGGLHACLEESATLNLDKGWKIRDVLVGVPDADQFQNGKVPVHVYSEPASPGQSY